MSYFIQNLRRFAREIGKEKPSRIPARLAAAARSKITVVGEAVLDRTGTGRLFGTRYRGQGVGLMFHEVHDDVEGGLRLGCNPAQLRRVLDALRREGREPVTADEALKRLADPDDNRPFAVLTFDDGYRDNVTQALPLLEEYAAPMTMFVPTGMVTREINAWWLGLRALFNGNDSVDIAPMGHRFECADRPSKNAAMRQTGLWVGTDRSRAEALQETFRAYGLDMAGLVAAVAMDADEIRHFATHPLVTIGGHTTSHTFLAGLDDAAAYRDIADNKAFLEDLLGAPVRHFAYPYGTPGACGAREAAYVEKAGFVSAYSTRPGHLFPAHAPSPFLMPREDVGFAHMTDAQLACRLDGSRRAFLTRFGNPVAGVA